MTLEEYAARIVTELKESWLPRLYCDRILKMRTRAYHFPELRRNIKVEIQHTLLGVELKLSRRRLLCPDLATARYLSVFAKAGCRNVAVPYDITRVSQLADELESSWYRMLLLADDTAAPQPHSLRTRLRGLLIAKLRGQIAAAGAGASIPEFKQNTKQRRS